MSFSRSYDSFPGYPELAKLEGTVVLHMTPARNPLGAGVGTVCLVGEVLNDRYSEAAKSAVKKLVEITSADQFDADYGGFSPKLGLASNGFEGNIGAALALAGMSFRRLLIVVPNLSAGQATFTRPAAGTASVAPTVAGPWPVANGDTIVFSVDGAANNTCTIQATKASRVGSGAAITSLTGLTLQVRIDGGAVQTFTFTASEVRIADVVDFLQTRLVGGYVALSAGQLLIASDTYGSASKVEIVGGTALAQLGHAVGTTETTGDDVADSRAMTVAEFKALVEGNSAAVVDATTGAISTSTQGEAGSIQVQASSTLDTIMGFDTNLHTGGDDAVAGTTIPAGTRVSDGGSHVYLTLESLAFPAGDAGTSLQQSVRVRPQSDTTESLLAGQLTTIVDALDDDTFTVTNAAALTVPNFDTAYAEAVAASSGATGLAGDIDILVSRRHTNAMRTALQANCAIAAAGKRARVGVYSPPIGTPNATAVGSSGVGIGTTREKHLVYAWPNFATLLLPYDPSNLVDFHADVYVAHLASIHHPVENIGEDRTAGIYVKALESGLDIAPSQSQYAAWRALGMASPQIDGGKAEILSDRTTELEEPNNELNHVRTVAWLATSLHDIGRAWAKKLRSGKNERAFTSEVTSFLSGLKSDNNPDAQLIEGFVVDAKSGNNDTTKAAGLYVCKVAVRTLGHMNTIVFALTSGKTVDVKVIA